MSPTPIDTAPADTARAMHAAYFGKDTAMDIYTNEKPLGLMSDELKAALRAHHRAGGAVECFSGEKWGYITYPQFTPTLTYRAVRPAPTPDVIAWDRLPGWVQSVARAESGRVYAFNNRYPLLVASGGGWIADARQRIDDFPGLVQIGTCDWKDSLQLRPALK